MRDILTIASLIIVSWAHTAYAQLAPGTYQFKIQVASLQSAAGSWQLYRGSGPEPAGNFIGFSDVDPTFQSFRTDIDPGDVSMRFLTQSQVLVWVNGGWSAFSVGALGNVTLNSARATVDGVAPGLPGGGSSWTVYPYGEQGFAQAIYPAGTLLTDLVGSVIGMNATKPDRGFPDPDNYVSVFRGSIDGSITVPPPTFTLFLDVDGFSISNPTGTDDKGWYVPGSTSGGASVSPSQLPQRIHIIAAYVGSSGTIVAPPSGGNAILSLSNVSAFKGIAMNASKKGRSDDAPDFEAVSAGVAFGADNTARFNVDCWDFGGFATATVTHGTGVNQVTAQLRLPADANGNDLPDAGWLATQNDQGTTVTTQVGDSGLATDDSDVGPTGSSALGDGLTNYEEYRGFIIQGAHVRTNPNVKDLFVNLQNSLPLGFAANLPFSKWSILTAEMATDRGINPNYTNAGSGGAIAGHFFQKALRIIDGGYNTANPGVVGLTSTTTNNPAPPSQVTVITIWTQSIRFLSPPHNTKNQADPVDPEKTNQTVAHEIGHGVSIPHIDVQLQCPLGTPTVMVTNYFQQTTNVNDCAWTHIPHFYASSDMNWLALR